MKELKEKFAGLTDEEKIEFAKTIMPEVCNLVKDDPQQMQEMMSSCMGMMKDGMDMGQMMQMMSKMKMMGNNNQK